MPLVTIFFDFQTHFLKTYFIEFLNQGFSRQSSESKGNSKFNEVCPIFFMTGPNCQKVYFKDLFFSF